MPARHLIRLFTARFGRDRADSIARKVVDEDED